jgi:hypothetical protein
MLTNDCEIDARIAGFGFSKIDATPVDGLVG